MTGTIPREEKIAKLVPGRELLIELDVTASDHRRRVREACERAAQITGLSYRLWATDRGVRVRCVTGKVKITTVAAERTERELKTWLREDRLGTGPERQFRLGRAWACLFRIKRDTGEALAAVVARFDAREVALLREDKYRCEAVGLNESEPWE